MHDLNISVRMNLSSGDCEKKPAFWEQAVGSHLITCRDRDGFSFSSFFGDETDKLLLLWNPCIDPMERSFRALVHREKKKILFVYFKKHHSSL
jgi:hypothetical protein